MIVLPNVLTETSNLLSQIKEPARSRLRAALASLVIASREIYIASLEAVLHKDYGRLGLTDSAILFALSKETELLTADLGLYLAATACGHSATNFTHLRFDA